MKKSKRNDKSKRKALPAYVNLVDHIAARTNLSSRLVRDAIDAGYVMVGKEIVVGRKQVEVDGVRQILSGYDWPAEEVYSQDITIKFPEFTLKPPVQAAA